MKLLSLTLKNYKCFEDFQIIFKETITVDGTEKVINLHVLLAPNMVGKSAVLKGLRIAIGASLQKIKANPGTPSILNISTDEHRVTGSDPFSDKARDVAIIATAKSKYWLSEKNGWIDRRYSWKKYKEDFTGKHSKVEHLEGNIITDTNNTFNRVIDQKTGIIPLLLYVGTEYVHQARAVTDTLDFNGSAKQGYWYCLDDKSMESYVFSWFKKLHRTDLEQQRAAIAKEYYGDFAAITLNLFKEALVAILPDIVDVAWVENTLAKKTDYSLIFKIDGQGVRTYEMLSDGYKYLVLLIGEMVTRATLLNKHLGKDVLQCIDGIVLIDEFGIHLHPALQADTLSRLSSTFPNVQFIVTTHSPLLVNGLYKEQIHIISEDQNGIRKATHPEDDAIGIGAEGILREMFGLTTTFDAETLKDSERYKVILLKKETATLTIEEEYEFKKLGNKLAMSRLDPSLEIVKPEGVIAQLVREKIDIDKANAADFTAKNADDLQNKVSSILDNILKRS